MITLKVLAPAAILLAFLGVTPVSAQATNPFWYAEKEGKLELLGETPVETTTKSATESTVAPEYTVKLPSGFELGPCSFTKTTDVWNDNNVGRSKIPSWSFQACKTNDPACKINPPVLTTKNLTGTLVYLEGNTPGEAIGNANNPVSITYEVVGGMCVPGGMYVTTSPGSLVAKHTGKGCYALVGLMSITNIPGLIGTASGQECRDKKGQTIIPK